MTHWYRRHEGDQGGRNWLRLCLGLLQMGAATVSVVLLIMTGVSPVALLATVSACVLTTVSVLLFGARAVQSTTRRSEGHDK